MSNQNIFPSNTIQPTIPSELQSNTNLLLDVILIDRTRRHVSIIYQNKNKEIILTEPSRTQTIPLFKNYPNKWLIPTSNISRPDSPNLSIFQINFTTTDNNENLLAQVSILKEKPLHLLDEFQNFHNLLQKFFAENGQLRNEVFQKVLAKEWNYSKHIPWNMIQVNKAGSKKQKTFFLTKTYQLINTNQPPSYTSTNLETYSPTNPSTDLQNQSFNNPITNQNSSLTITTSQSTASQSNSDQLKDIQSNYSNQQNQPSNHNYSSS
jgi:hypothetical protein